MFTLRGAVDALEILGSGVGHLAGTLQEAAKSVYVGGGYGIRELQEGGPENNSVSLRRGLDSFSRSEGRGM